MLDFAGLHESLKSLVTGLLSNRRQFLLAIVIGCTFGLIYAATADAAINLQAAKQRTHRVMYLHCKDNEIFSRGLYYCMDQRRKGVTNVQVYSCKYTILSARRVKCDADYLLRNMVSGQLIHCYSRVKWKGNHNNIRQYGRFKVSCQPANQG